VDAAEAAPHFGLAAAEVRMKANYGLPEIWFAGEDEAKLQDTSAALEAVGFKSVLVAGSDLVEVPEQSPAVSFVFTDDGLSLEGDDSGWTMAYDVPTLAVFCRPRGGALDARQPSKSITSQFLSSGRMGIGRPSPGSGQVDAGPSAFLDFYLSSDTGLLRISIVQEITSFSQLPGDPSSGLSPMQNLVAECEDRFENVHVDRRLEDMTLRGATRVVTEGAAPPGPTRAGFSYATEALAGLLGSLSPDLTDISQPDLSSRLAYLTSRSRIS
jgi:hypothetical protein